MQETPKVGALITEDNAGRDAIHVPIIPLVAGEKLYPGLRIRLQDDRAYIAREEINLTTGALESKDVIVGIVDPFLPPHKWIMPGERFYGFLFPGTVTSLRHVWVSPLFKPKLPHLKTGATNDRPDVLSEVRTD